MKKYLIILIIFCFFVALSGKVYAVENSLGNTEKLAASSAAIHIEKEETKEDKRVLVLKKFFEKYNSPFVDYADKFIEEADKQHIPWTLVASISGVESSFGLFIPYNSYNAWGWNNGNYGFKNWEEGIEVVTKALRNNYFNRGADNVYKIAPIYAPPSTTWAGKVTYFMQQIEKINPDSSSTLQISL
ncbi:MAG: hypothetical protein UT63_C0064G0019 [Candidatus Gottesmanbacteria bacterium GW2011_GWC2_39_8]|uniref:Mannosyl-glycoprotein endo-beta-N-acetylglucosamidase-like domain-containing protein n=1 Tax=Candidatus Gottesmanbacteria bacterium GW2011_GWC2_39_8 TaxID=1618450 RepID=A0A0G0T1D4_9BACT|nr:MAG: hypothetical protein UT63_C0064G0019 [Candidatus Gottesmanbacteria bacterium GW2011_GWC2_39_8]